MKRTVICTLFLLACMAPIFAQDSTIEGFDGFAWGTTIKQVKQKYPNCINLTDEDAKQKNEYVLFHKESATVFKMFAFVNNELVAGQTLYANLSKEEVNKLIDSVPEIYGEPLLSDADKSKVNKKI